MLPFYKENFSKGQPLNILYSLFQAEMKMPLKKSKEKTTFLVKLKIIKKILKNIQLKCFKYKII